MIPAKKMGEKKTAVICGINVNTRSMWKPGRKRSRTTCVGAKKRRFFLRYRRRRKGKETDAATSSLVKKEGGGGGKKKKKKKSCGCRAVDKDLVQDKKG